MSSFEPATMTVMYTDEVANATFGIYFKLLFRYYIGLLIEYVGSAYIYIFNYYFKFTFLKFCDFLRVYNLSNE